MRAVRWIVASLTLVSSHVAYGQLRPLGTPLTPAQIDSAILKFGTKEQRDSLLRAHARDSLAKKDGRATAPPSATPKKSPGRKAIAPTDSMKAKKPKPPIG